MELCIFSNLPILLHEHARHGRPHPTPTERQFVFMIYVTDNKRTDEYMSKIFSKDEKYKLQYKIKMPLYILMFCSLKKKNRQSQPYVGSHAWPV
jgi:hypothetical protein